KVTHLNAMRIFNAEMGKHIKKEELTVGALRAKAKAYGVDATPTSMSGEKPLDDAEGMRRITSGDLAKMFAHHGQKKTGS
ncbi:hypothetical protein, partial [Mangrovimicrobium sediminis]|uniref:hypothetical protein n=1 Tax=Mangrovimicrobium sediminis TaxID=2562682 RepID=UPI00197FD1B0